MSIEWKESVQVSVKQIELPDKIWTMMHCCVDTVRHPVPLILRVMKVIQDVLAMTFKFVSINGSGGIQSIDELSNAFD